MLGRKDFTPEELSNAQSAIANELSAYKKLAKAVEQTADPGATAALEELEPLLFNNLALTLDRFFVHRIRMVTGKDGNPVNELELLSDSLINNGGELRTGTVIKYVPEESVLKLAPGDEIRLSAAQFQRLSKAFLEELERRFVK